MNAVWTIARREVRSFFDHPMGYILLVVFIGLNNFLFFSQAYQIGLAELRPMLGLLPWLFLFFIPAVTMRALAEDLRSGTIEVVLAQPITELELLAGKYLGQVLFIWIALGLTIAIPVGLGLGADLQLGVIFAQYCGAALFAAGFAAIGVWASSLGNTQITAFIVGVAVMFLFVFMGLDMLVTGLPPMLATAAANLGVLSHFENIARGVVDLRDVVYFLTLSAAFLVLAYGVLIGRKLAPKGEALKRLRLGTAILVVTLVVVNLFGRHIGGRIDFTPGNVYTLSRATKEIVRNLNDIVTIRLFVSEELPPQIALSKRDIDDLLGDIRSAGRGNVRIVEQDPAEDEEIANEARSLGIMPVQFNVVGQDQLTVQEGYMGLAVQYADETETIPLIRRTDDLEYRLASFIRTLTRETQPVIGLVTEEGMAMPGQQAQGPTYNVIRSALSENYEVRDIDVAQHLLAPGEISTLVLAGSPPVIEDSIAIKLQDYLNSGGSALVMASGMQLGAQMQQMFAGPTPVAWNRVLEPYGVSINANMVFDLLANERVSVPANMGMRIFVSYPFWLRGLSTKAASINQELESLFLPWTSEVDTSGVAPGSLTPLFVTSEAGGVEEGQVYVQPRREFPQTDLARRLVGVMVNPMAGDADGASSAGDSEQDASEAATMRGRLVVIANHEFVTDQWIRNAPQNGTFLLNAVDWLAQDEGLIEIRSKDRSPPPLVFESATVRDFIRYGNVFGIPLLIVLAAFFRMLKRKQKMRQQYTPLNRQEVA